MDGKITGMEMQWNRRVAYTWEKTVAIETKVPDRHGVFVDIQCNGCGCKTTLRFGESYPGGEFGIEEQKNGRAV